MTERGAAKGFRASFKESDVEATIDAYFFRPLAELMVGVLAKTRVRPNQVSFASALAGIASALCYYQFSYPFIVAGGLLLALSVIFDAGDGQLARRTGQGSEVGKLFDNVMDPIKAVSAMFGMAFGMDAVGHWGDWPPMPPQLTTAEAIWGLGWFSGICLSLQVVTRNYWVDRYHAYGKGRTSLTMADLRLVREEMQVLRQKSGYWLEKSIVPVVLAFSKKNATPPQSQGEHPEYVDALRPYVRWWTIFGGGQQFFVLLIASLFGLPIVGWLYISVLGNAIYLPLLLLTWRADRRARSAQG